MKLNVAHVLVGQFPEEIVHLFVIVKAHFHLPSKHGKPDHIHIDVRVVIEFHVIHSLLLFVDVLV